MAPKNLLWMLREAAEKGANRGLTLEYDNPRAAKSISLVTYATLYKKSLVRGHTLSSSAALTRNSIVLLHTSDHEESISWFWAIVAAGGVPCILTQVLNLDERKSYIRSLLKLLGNPLIITNSELITQLSDIPQVRIFATEKIDAHLRPLTNEFSKGLLKEASDLAILMLTGDMKAMHITHENVMASLDAKIQLHSTTSRDIFLNLNTLDHIANLFDTHLHATRLTASQVHVSQTLLLTPSKLLDKLSYYKASYTFAPNFFIWDICQEFEAEVKTHQATDKDNFSKRFDLSCLKGFFSGCDKINITETCVRFTALLQKFGAPKSFLRPSLAFPGTCGGALYSFDCPASDIKNRKQWCSVGFPTSAVSVRVVADGGGAIEKNETGHLELSGPAVFSRYFNDIAATVKAFSRDGWYKTGEMGYFDNSGALYITGRHDDYMRINGMKLSPVAIENAILSTKIYGIMSSRLIAFPHRQSDFNTDSIYIVYRPIFNAAVDTNLRLTTSAAISQAVIRFFGVRPCKVIPIEEHQLQRTAIGKLSRPKTRLAFEKGAYTTCKSADMNLANSIKMQFQLGIKNEFGATHLEQTILGIFLDVFPPGSSMLSIKPTNELLDPGTPLFDLGLTSFEIMKFKFALQTRLKMPDFSVRTLFANPTVRELANCISTGDYVYSPVATLRLTGEKTPLWFVHDELGDVYSFIGLARLITNRPIHILHLNLNPNPNSPFPPLPALLTTYHKALTSIQPHGPYALTGLSSGSILAYELSKRLKNVQFLAFISPPLPPRPPLATDIVGKQDYAHKLCHIATSFGLLTPENVKAILNKLHPPIQDPESVCLDEVIKAAGAEAMKEVGVDGPALHLWASTSSSLQQVMRKWSIEGKVKELDVFTVPDGGLGKWKGFVDGECRFWKVGGDGGSRGREIIQGGGMKEFVGVLGEAMGRRGV
ncbi:hypothetical protein HYALB_00011045 [Hymenoscyphus albidus]|uniref:Carrier domain-containing protein n=1 Tax=Hymenoscyphus albidus TaxID=595503 RepID=A0A9N9QAW0_9HELO|nr:hypothetical protein HYALB_00011045 [Hymenoscyphus albidus]